MNASRPQVLILALIAVVLLAVSHVTRAHAVSLQPGWPQYFGTGGGTVVGGSPALGDLDGDGDLEVVVASSDRRVYAWHHDGTVVAGWPQSVGLLSLSGKSPVLGDVDGDGRLDVVIGASLPSPAGGVVFAWHGDGTSVTGWPSTLTDAVGNPALGDLDGDGHLEVVVGCRDHNVYAWHGDGTPVAGWPRATGGDAAGWPTLADLGGDGHLEVIVAAGDAKVYVWDGSGTLAAGWPQSTGVVAGGTTVGDLDGDGHPEILAGGGVPDPGGIPPFDAVLFVFRDDGTPLIGWPQSTPWRSAAPPRLGDLDGAGDLEFVTADGFSDDFWAAYDNGTVMPHWPWLATGITPVLADVDGDGYLEIVAPADYKIYAWHGDPWFPVAGWPQAFGETSSECAIADLDGDGSVEVVAGTPVVAGTFPGAVYVWTSEVPTTNPVPWPMFLHDAQHTGRADAAALTRGKIAGQVRISGTGAPLAGVTVEAYLGDTLQGTAVTRADGSYKIQTALAPGAYTVVARKLYYVSGSQSGVAVTVGQISAANFDLQPAARLMGQVSERGTNRILANATVAAYVGGNLVATTTTDSGGIYEIETPIAASNYVVSAAKRGWETQTKNHIVAAVGQTTYVSFWLNPAPPLLKGQVRDRATGASLVGARVSVYQGDTCVAYTTTNAPYGLYQFGAILLPGVYSAVASKPGYLPQFKGNITVADGATAYVNFNLAAGQVPCIAGQVSDRVTLTPIVGATVKVYRWGATLATATTAAPWGTYAVDAALTQGTYVVEASAAGYSPQGRNMVSVIPGLTTYVNFFLQAQ